MASEGEDTGFFSSLSKALAGWGASSPQENAIFKLTKDGNVRALVYGTCL